MALSATELRIGNLVYYDKTSVIIEIGDLVVLQQHEKKELPTLYGPIPLTEEWPLKFRFKRLSHSNDYLKGDFKIDLKGYFFIYIKDIGWILLCQVKYIHKLQNLYFALTGQELEMK